MAQTIQRPVAGCVVEFMQGNQPHLALVLEEQSGRLKLFTHTHREVSLTANRLLPWSGPALPAPGSRNEAEAILARHQENRQALYNQIDAIALWEMAQGEVAEASAEWFAELLFSTPDHDQIAAVGRALLGRKTHFKLQPPTFQVYTASMVESRQAEELETQAREELLRVGQPLFKDLWQGRVPHTPASPAVDQLKSLLLERLRGSDADGAAASPSANNSGPASGLLLWKELTRGLPEHPHLALILAERWGVVPCHYNFHLDRTEYAWGDSWSQSFVAEVEMTRAAAAAQLNGVPEDPRSFIAIDAATTTDIDDAFSLSDDGTRLAVALACPVVDLESPLGRAVLHRATSLYLPDGVSHMLPKVLAEETFSLKGDKPRAALIMDFDMGSTQADEPRLAGIRLAAIQPANITYHAAQDLLTAAETPMWGQTAQLAQRLRERRIRKGAVVIDREDPELILEGQGADVTVRLEPKDPTPTAQLLVSELMILANEAAARYAQDNGLPLLFRAQESSIPPEAAGVWTSPEDIQRAVKLLGPSCLGMEALPHRGLGLSAYAPCTSPIRRITDLINAQQLLAHVTTGEPRWDRAEVAAMLPEVCARLDAVGQVQKFRPRYWKLVFIQQNRTSRAFTGVAVDEAGTFATLAIPELQLYVRTPKKLLGEGLHAGQRFGVMFGRVDPLCNELRVAEAWEEPPEEFLSEA